MRYPEFCKNNHLITQTLDETRKPAFGEEAYGTWTIKSRNTPKDDKYDAVGINVRHPTMVKGSGSNQDQAIAAVKLEIDRLIRNDDSVLKFSKGAINFNVEFTREFMRNGPTGVRLVKNGSETLLIVCGEKYSSGNDKDVFGKANDQFAKMHTRAGSSNDPLSDSTPIYGAGITINKIRELGLQPNGRYALTYLRTDPDRGHQLYKLVFDSITASATDKQRLHTPGLTIAVY